MNRLEGIEARLAGVTREPWRYIDGCILSTDGTIVAQTWSKLEEDFPNHKQNGELMAAAPADLALLASAVRAAVRWSIAQRNWHTLAEDDPDDRYWDRYWAACEVFYQTEDELDAALEPLLKEVE